jgi:hypothetical protein
LLSASMTACLFFSLVLPVMIYLLDFSLSPPNAFGLR